MKKFPTKTLIVVTFSLFFFTFLTLTAQAAKSPGAFSGCGGSTTVPYNYQFCFSGSGGSGTATFSWTVGTSVAQMPDYCEINGFGSTQSSGPISGFASSVSFSIINVPTAPGTYTVTGTCYNDVSGTRSVAGLGSSQSVSFTISPAGGGGGGPSSTTLAVTVNAPSPLSVSWAIAPGNFSGAGSNLAAAVVTPPGSGSTLYTLSYIYPGGTCTVTNDATGSNGNVIPVYFDDQGVVYNYNLACVLDATATLDVTSTSCTTAGLSWIIKPGTISGSGTAKSYTVNPASGGTTYTITPRVTTGTIGAVTNSDGGGSSLTLFVGDSKSFNITCIPPSATAPTVTISASPSTITLGGSSTLTWSSTYTTSCTASGAWSGSQLTAGSLSVSPITSSTYTISCTGPGGSANTFATVTVNPPVPVVTISASPSSGTVNVVNPTLTWTTTNSPTSCTATGDWSGSPAIAGGSQSMGILTTVKTYSYTITCSNAGGASGLVTATVVVSAPVLAPVVTLTRSPISGTVNVVNPTLTWSVTNSPTSCTASGDWGGAKAVAGGSQVMGILTSVKTYTYGLSCTNAGGTGTKNVTVIVYPPIPVVTISASPSSGTVNVVNPTLTWTTTNSPTSCTATGDWSGSKAVAGGSQVMGVLTTVKTYSYTLACNNGSGTSTPAVATVVSNAITTANISVVSNLSTAGWTINPGALTGTGSGSVVVTPGAGGTTYIFTPATVSGYTSAVSPGSSLAVFPGDTPVFTVTYTALPPVPIVTVSVSPTSGTAGVVNPTITWTTTNSPTSCTATDFWSGSKAVAGGSQSMGVIATAGTYTYTLTCTNAGGTSAPATGTLVVNPATPVPVVTISASPSSGTVNVVNPTLTWTTTNSPTSCTATGDWSGSPAIAGGSQSMGILTTVKTYSYTITCSNAGGASGLVTATVVVSAGTPVPVVTIAVSPTTGIAGVVNPTITWTTTNSPTSCTATSWWSGNKAVGGGSQSMGIISTVGTYTYTLTCTNAGGTSTPVTATLTTSAPPTAPVVTLTSSPTNINLGNSSTLTWSTTNATSCSAPWTGSTGASGSQSVSPVLNTTYTLTCVGPGGTSTDSVTIGVVITAGISVASNLSTAGWTINPGAFAGTGSGSVTVSPGAGGTTYIFTPTTVSGYTSAVSPGTSLTVFPGDTPTITVTYTLVASIPVVTLTASPTSGVVNVVNPTLTWTTTNSPTSCAATGDWSGSPAVGGGSQSMGVLTTVKTYTYTLTCTNAGGTSASVSATVTVNASVVAPVITLIASPTSGAVNVVNPILTWTTTNSPTSCTASNSWSGAKAVAGGSQTMGILNTVKTYTYTLTCSNTSGTVSKSATVVVSAIPVVTISVNPTSGVVNVVNPSLTWSSANSATTCTASGDWSGNRLTANTISMGVLTVAKTYTYTLACNNGAGTSTPVSATVVVNPATVINVSSNLSTAGWTINPGGFSGTGSGSVNVVPGGSGTLFTITPASVAGYTDTVSPGTSLTVFTGDTPTFTLAYSAIIPSFDYSISATSVTIKQGQVGQSTVTESYIQGDSQPVYLSVSGLPLGVAVSYAPQPCTPTCTSPLNIGLTVSGSATVGTYTITIDADTVPASTPRSTTFSLTINPAPALTVVCRSELASVVQGNQTSSPTFIQINQSIAWIVDVTGGIAPITYDWTGTDFPTAPNPSTNPFFFTYQTTGVKTVQVTVIDNGGVRTATCPSTTLQVGVKPSFQEF